MAWTEQCKIDAKSQVDHLVKAKGMKKKQAIRELSKESGIPINTLKRWYWPSQENGVKNDPDISPNQAENYPTCDISDLQAIINSGQTFNTVYADPPWNYGNQATRASTGNHYQTMTPESIAGLPIPNIAADNAHLHLWTTNGFLFEAKSIMEAWGFTYKSCMVWVKPQMGIGNYWRVSHEFLLFGLRGKSPFLNRGFKSWIEAKRSKHSKKPEVFRQAIEKVSPGPYIELFGRNTVPGWTVWGNEIKKNLFSNPVASVLLTPH
jgi:N6-adenosine-specific RNA methylase IME4